MSGQSPGKPARRRLSPDDRRTELLKLGATVFGERPYDEVRVDEIAERAGISRALMYHYFPDKRAFFAAVLRAEGERLFDATSTPARPGQSLFDQVRSGVAAYVEYHERHPHGSWAAHAGIGRSDPTLLGIDDQDNERQMLRILDAIGTVAPDLDAEVERDLQAIVYGWLAFTLELCRRRIVEPSLDADQISDACAHALLDAIARVPAIPAALAAAIVDR
jgi:AcrR family transcriptional regulator